MPLLIGANTSKSKSGSVTREGRSSFAHETHVVRNCDPRPEAGNRITECVLDFFTEGGIGPWWI